MRTLHPIELEALQIIRSSGPHDMLPMFYKGAYERLALQGYIVIVRDAVHPPTGKVMDYYDITPQGDLALRLHEADKLLSDLGRI